MTDDFVEAIAGPSNEELDQVVALAREQIVLEREIARLEDEIGELKGRLAVVRDDRLPKTLLAIGATECPLSNGYRVQVKERYQCSQLDDAPDVDDKRRPLRERMEAIDWLDRNGHGDIARRVVTVVLGSKSEDIAGEILDIIRSHPAANQFAVDQRRLVPWNTLSKFAREQMQEGYDPPLDLLGVSIQTSAKIVKPGEKEEF